MPYRGDPDIKKPSGQLYDLLSGKVAPKDTPDAILSWARLEVYRGAVAVLDKPTKKERQATLAKIPQSIRPYVEREARAIWEKRRGKA